MNRTFAMHRFSSIGARLMTAFLALAAVVALVSLLALRSTGAADSRFSEFVDGIDERAQLAAELRKAVDVRAISARNLVLVTAQADREAETELVRKAHRQVQERLGKLRALASAPGVEDDERATIQRIVQVEEQYGPVALAIVDLALANRHAAAIEDMNTKCRPLLARLVKATDDFAELARTKATERIAASHADYRSDVVMLLSITAVAVLAAALAGWWVTRSITTPIRSAVEVAQSVAAGDLRTEVRSLRNDETGRLLEALQAMTGSLRRIVGTVRESTDSIATGSRQISAGNSDLSHRTEQQASSLQETNASMQQLRQTVQETAQRAEQATALAQAAMQVATRGGEVVGTVVSTMGDIAQSSRRISEITSIIEGIAFQTNILALNAAVEAARAGEQGRGFAVVAAEVRQLAQRSSEATQQIGALIAESRDKVDAGSDQVAVAGRTMGEIVQQVAEVSGLIAEIGAATRTQAEGIQQVGEAVVLLDTVTQQNAALVEESAAAANSLDRQATRLVETVREFKLAAA
jgi:methyl-accepting chemotaxis protein-1 (serine sensor receptor)